MRSAAALAVSLLAAAAAAQQTHNVTVGMGALAFNPPSITAAVGDIISFTFYPKNHSVTQSSFAQPCQAAFDATTGQQGFTSGFHPVANGTTSAPMTIRVTTTTPLWFFCAQQNPMPHCQQGMVFAVNPTADKSFAAFQAAAKAAGPSTTPAAGAGAGTTPPTTGATTPPVAGGTGASTTLPGAAVGGGSATIANGAGSTVSTTDSTSSSATSPAASGTGAASALSAGRLTLAAAVLAGAALL